MSWAAISASAAKKTILDGHIQRLQALVSLDRQHNHRSSFATAAADRLGAGEVDPPAGPANRFVRVQHLHALIGMVELVFFILAECATNSGFGGGWLVSVAVGPADMADARRMLVGSRDRFEKFRESGLRTESRPRKFTGKSETVGIDENPTMRHF